VEKEDDLLRRERNLKAAPVGIVGGEILQILQGDPASKPDGRLWRAPDLEGIGNPKRVTSTR